MNKYTYLYELRRELSFLAPEDLEAAVRFYEEYFAEAGLENEKEAIARLGSPKLLAAEIRKENEEKIPTGNDLAVLETKPADDESTDSFWQGENYVGPEPPWRGKSDDCDSDTKNRDTQDGQNDPNQQDPDDWGHKDDEWSHKADEWGRRAGEWGQRAGYKAAIWSRKAEEKAQEWARIAEEKAREWSSKAEGTSKERSHDYEDTGKSHYRYKTWRSAQSSRYNIGAIILLCLLSPVIVPLIFSAIVAVISLFGAIFISGIAMIVSGAVIFATGIPALHNLPEMLLRFGAGLMLIGAGIAITALSSKIFAWLFRTIRESIARLKDRYFKKGKEKT